MTQDDLKEVFIQDQKATIEDWSEEESQYVISKVYENGDVDDVAYSDDEEEIKQDLRDMGYIPVETSNGYDGIPEDKVHMPEHDIEVAEHSLDKKVVWLNGKDLYETYGDSGEAERWAERLREAIDLA